LPDGSNTRFAPRPVPSQIRYARLVSRHDDLEMH
jgi:hypothetical protein